MKNYLKGLTNLFTAATVTVTLMLVLPLYAFGVLADSLSPLTDRTVEILISHEQATLLPMCKTNTDLRPQAQRPLLMLAAVSDDEDEDNVDEEKNGEDAAKKDEDAPEPRCWDHPCLG